MLGDQEEVVPEIFENVVNVKKFDIVKKEQEHEQETLSSDLEMDLDLPAKKVKTMNRIVDSSSGEQEEEENSNAENTDSSSNFGNISDGALQDSSADEESSSNISSQTLSSSANYKKMKKKQKFLSREFILNSDTDEGEEHLILNSSEDDSGNEADDTNERIIRKKVSKKIKSDKKEKDKKKAKTFLSADFNETLRRIDFNDTESDIDSNTESDSSSRYLAKDVIKKKIKKPKDTLKKTLTEAEALIRGEMEEIDLNVEVKKFKDLNIVLNEALAFNSKTPAESRKKVIEATRNQQRKKLEKFLGAEKMKEISNDDPKIGFKGLDETLEIEFEADEKGPINGVAHEKMNFKLIDLPNKHFDGKSRDMNEKASYKAHLPIYKKASIEILNAQLQEKINAQSKAHFANHQLKAKAHAMALKRAKMEAQEKNQHKIAVKKEKELKELRDKKVSGEELFKKKYEGIERPDQVLMSRNRSLGIDDPENYSDNLAAMDQKRYDVIDDGFNIRSKSKRIMLSDDSDSDLNQDRDRRDLGSDSGAESTETDEDEDLLNLDSADEDENNENVLPEMNEAIKTNVEFGEFDELLSGSFEKTKTQLKDRQPINKDLAIKVKIMKNIRKRSEFLDDEASDEEEDEERETEFIDEEALDKEMKESKFIAEDDESDSEIVNQHELNSYRANQNIKEDMELIQKLKERFGGHLREEDGKELGKLEEKYGLYSNSSNYLNSNTTSTVYNNQRLNLELDDDIKKLLDPLEQKKKKLSALGSINLLERKRLIKAASDEFVFKEETKLKNKLKDNSDMKNKKISSNNNNEEEGEIIGRFGFESESDYYGSSDLDLSDLDSDQNDLEENEYYDPIESGLQSKVGEMLDVESLDVEEVQVQASENLRKHLKSFAEEPISDSYSSFNNDNDININTVFSSNNNNNKNINNNKPNKGMIVPNDAKMRSRLMALEGGGDDSNYNNNDNSSNNSNGTNNAFNGKKPFKGFVKM